MGNPFKQEYPTVAGRASHDEYLQRLAWEEGHTAAKSEQAEIVSELVTALSFYLVDWSVDETIHQATIDFAIAAQEKARKATQ